MDDVEWIREGLRRSGKSRAALAQALGRAPSAITSLLGPEKPSDKRGQDKKGGRPQKPRQLKSHEISTIAEFLGIEPPLAYNLRRVPVMLARRQAVATALLESGGTQDQREIAVTEGDTSSVAALGLQGGAMLGLKAGTWLFFHDEPILENFDNLAERLCVIYLDSDEVIVGTIRPSLYGGRFDTLDFFERKDVLARLVVKAAAVTAMIPPPTSELYLNDSEIPETREILKAGKTA